MPAAPHFDPTMRRLTPQSVMQLRAAIAAVNAIECARRGPQRHVAQDPALRGPWRGRRAGAGRLPAGRGDRLRPRERSRSSPRFTRTPTRDTSNAGTVNPQGYVAIELYNPYPFDIPLTEYRLAIINRLGTATGGAEAAVQQDLPVRELVNFSDPAAGTPPTPVVPAPRLSLILENYNAARHVRRRYTRPAYRPARAPGCRRTGMPATGHGRHDAASPGGDAPHAAAGRTSRTCAPQRHRAASAQTHPGDDLQPGDGAAKAPQLRRRTPTTIAVGDSGAGRRADQTTRRRTRITSATWSRSTRSTSPGWSCRSSGNVARCRRHGRHEAQAWHYMREQQGSATGARPDEELALRLSRALRRDQHGCHPATPWNIAAASAAGRYALHAHVGSRHRARRVGSPRDLGRTTNPAPGGAAVGTCPPAPEMTLGETYGVPAGPGDSTRRRSLRTTRRSRRSSASAISTTSQPRRPGGSIGHNPILGAGRSRSRTAASAATATCCTCRSSATYIITPSAWIRRRRTRRRIPRCRPATSAARLTSIEMNSVTMDAAMAEDSDPGDDPQYTGPGRRRRKARRWTCRPADPAVRAARPLLPRHPRPTRAGPGALPQLRVGRRTCWTISPRSRISRRLHAQHRPRALPRRRPRRRAASPTQRRVRQHRPGLRRRRAGADQRQHRVVEGARLAAAGGGRRCERQTGTGVPGDRDQPEPGAGAGDRLLPRRGRWHRHSRTDRSRASSSSTPSSTHARAGSATGSGFQNMMGRCTLRRRRRPDPGDGQGDFSPMGPPSRRDQRWRRVRPPADRHRRRPPRLRREEPQPDPPEQPADHALGHVHVLHAGAGLDEHRHDDAAARRRAARARSSSTAARCPPATAARRARTFRRSRPTCSSANARSGKPKR